MLQFPRSHPKQLNFAPKGTQEKKDAQKEDGKNLTLLQKYKVYTHDELTSKDEYEKSLK